MIQHNVLRINEQTCCELLSRFVILQGYVPTSFFSLVFSKLKRKLELKKASF